MSHLQVKGVRKDAFVYRSLVRHDGLDLMEVTAENSVDLMTSLKLTWCCKRDEGLGSRVICNKIIYWCWEVKLRTKEDVEWIHLTSRVSVISSYLL